MTTLQVKTKAFPASIPSTISHNQASPSSQFLSFRVQSDNSASEGWGLETKDLSFSTPGKSSIQEGPSSNTGASYNEARVKAATSTRAKHMTSRKRGSTETKIGSHPGRQTHRSISIGEIPPNLSTPGVRRQPIDWFGNGGGEDGVDDGQISPSQGAASVLDDRKNSSSTSQPIDDTGRRYPIRASGFPRLPRGTGDRGRSAITTRRQALQPPVGEDSYVSIGKVSRGFPPPLAAANDRRFIRREDVFYDTRFNEGRSDAFYRDTVPPERPPLNYYARNDYRDDDYSPSPPRHHRVYPGNRYGPPPLLPPPPANWPGGAPPRPGTLPNGLSIVVLPAIGRGGNTKSRREKSSKTMGGWMPGKPTKSSSGKRSSVSSTEGSPTRPARPSDGIFQHNAPPVITDLGRWQNRKAKLWTELNPTISKDNTMGEAAQQAKMLADFGKKNRHGILGVRIEVHTSEEEHPYDSVDEPLDSPPTPRS
jgi:hypothetical protein